MSRFGSEPLKFFPPSWLIYWIREVVSKNLTTSAETENFSFNRHWLVAASMNKGPQDRMGWSVLPLLREELMKAEHSCLWKIERKRPLEASSWGAFPWCFLLGTSGGSLSCTRALWLPLYLRIYFLSSTDLSYLWIPYFFPHNCFSIKRLPKKAGTRPKPFNSRFQVRIQNRLFLSFPEEERTPPDP